MGHGPSKQRGRSRNFLYDRAYFEIFTNFPGNNAWSFMKKISSVFRGLFGFGGGTVCVYWGPFKYSSFFLLQIKKDRNTKHLVLDCCWLSILSQCSVSTSLTSVGVVSDDKFKISLKIYLYVNTYLLYCQWDEWKCKLLYCIVVYCCTIQG